MGFESHGRSLSAARKITTVAIMTAIAYVLMLLEFPIPIMPSFIKLDFSELPALLASFSLGPWYGALVCILKNLLHLPFSGSLYIGELSNVLLGLFFVVPAGYIYQANRTKKGALMASLFGALVMAIVCMPINYFLIYPLYGKFMNFTNDIILGLYQVIMPSLKNLPQALLIFNVPFTFGKGLCDVALTFLIYKRISPLIQGTNSKKKKAITLPEEKKD